MDLNSFLNESTGLVTIPFGEYRIDSPIVLPNTVGAVQGYGVKIILSKQFVGESAIIASGKHKDRIRECKISGIEIDCKGQKVIGLDSTYSRRLYLDDLWIHNSNSHGVRIQNAWDLHMSRCWILDCGTRDIAAMEMGGDLSEHGTRTATIQNCTIQRFPGTALNMKNQKSVYLLNCKFEGVSAVQELPISYLCINVEACDSVRIHEPLLVLAKHDLFISESRDILMNNPINRIPVLIKG